MSSTNQCSAQADSAIADDRFKFISIQIPEDVKIRATRRQARSHAVKQALKKKRNAQEESMDHFRVATSQNKSQRLEKREKNRTKCLDARLFSLSASALDPFQTLAVDSSRLQTLLRNYKARQAPEPVFSVAAELAFQNFQSVFRTGFVDPALMNAAMLTFAFAVTGGSIDRECLGYQVQAISHVREKMSCTAEAASESTIGAILLLAGVEAQLGMTSQVQLHMGAVEQLLNICRTDGIFLTAGIKRAIFWQDLNSTIFTGSKRIVDHTTFAELLWARDPFSPTFYRLAPGFQTRSHLFGKDFIEVLEDINALQCIRNRPHPGTADVMMMAYVNNHTASIQSRLVSLPNTSTFLKCCHLAAYLCSVMLCCKVWCALAIPPHIASQLLHELQQANDDTTWDDHPDLLLWLLYIGGAFAPSGPVRAHYIALIRFKNASRCNHLYSSWPELLDILKQFIWSDSAFMMQVRGLWEEASLDTSHDQQ